MGRIKSVLGKTLLLKSMQRLTQTFSLVQNISIGSRRIIVHRLALTGLAASHSHNYDDVRSLTGISGHCFVCSDKSRRPKTSYLLRIRMGERKRLERKTPEALKSIADNNAKQC